jgi:predicted PurR-regulated permease PerM
MNDQVQEPREAPVSRRDEPGYRGWPEIVIAIGVIVAFCYFAEWELVTVLISILLSFILAPVVDVLQRIRLPRGVASFIAVMLLLASLYGGAYFSYSQTVSFIENLPKYSSKIRAVVGRFRKSAERLENTTATVLETNREEKNAVTIRSASSWTDVFTKGLGSFSHGLLVLSFIPFLVYFMLTWQQHVRSATVMLFSMEHRHAAYQTLGLISAMVRSFIVGNFLVGFFIAAVSTAVFAVVGVPFFYVVGVISGFLSLIPYLGVVLALVVPMMVGVGQLQSTDLMFVTVTVIGLHVIGLNILYPKFLGRRLQLNPLAVTLFLLFWGWLWGAVGLVLAIPLTGAMKIIFDHVKRLRPYGAWLGE